MNEAGQQAGRDRDEAGQADGISIPWRPRTDDKRALLVNARQTVFDRPREDLQPADPVDEISDPIWNHRAFRAWTPDLVHCRLLVCGQTIRLLPPAMRTGLVSQMGAIAIAEMAGERRRGATPAEISALDWTWPRLVRANQLLQRILMASAFGNSLQEIADVMKLAGFKTSKDSVRRLYMAEKLRMAAAWQAEHHPVDASTVDRWHVIFDKGQK